MPVSCEMPRRLDRRSAVLQSLPPTIIYLSVALLVVAFLPARAWYFKGHTLIAISLFGMWRYSWQVVHVIRHWWYRNHMFPKLRAAANAVSNPHPQRLYIMVPSFKEDPNITEMVFESLVREARSIKSQVMIVASVGSDRESDFISRVVNGVRGGEDVDLLFMKQGQGKRVAMGHALRAIARDFNSPTSWHGDAENDVVIFMDGDTLLEPGTLEKCLPFFRTHPKMAALTTDNIGMQQDCSSIFHDWYSLKFAQRNHQFHSHSLSKRVLTITGRFSMYRADVVVREDFIRFVEADYLESWMFGRFRFLMGDDKSTWFYLLKKGYEMLYVPDAPVIAVESRQDDFIGTSVSLMKRWYGNMLRNNMRAVRLGPAPMGSFIWWCILDQRFTTWTPLVGPASVIMLSVFVSPFYFAFYFSWVILTRLAMLWIYVFQGFGLRSTHLPLMLYNQWVGAAIKILTMYNLDKQSWQKKKSDSQKIEGEGFGMAKVRRSIRVMLVLLNFIMLFTFSGLGTGAISTPSLGYEISAMVHPVQKASAQSGAQEVVLNTFPGSDIGADIMSAVAVADPSRMLHITMPVGSFVVDTPVVIKRDNVTIAGHGPGRTVLVSRLDAMKAQAVFSVIGYKGPQVGVLTEPYDPTTNMVFVSDWRDDADAVWLGIENDEAFLDEINAKYWRKPFPPLRQVLCRVESSGADLIMMRHSPGISFPAGTEVHTPKLRHKVEFSGFTLRQEVPGMTRLDADGVYENIAPDYAVDGVLFKWAQGCLMDNVEIIMAGRHPVEIESSAVILVRNARIDGAWNKGKEGNGYFRISRSHECRVVDSSIRNVRHLTLQWSSSHNVIQDCDIETDVNFHGGYSHHNTVKDCIIHPPAGHKWKAVTRMPEGGAEYAPPDGPDNEVVY